MRPVTKLVAGAALACATGCFGTPTPLAPTLRGSVGVPHHGVLTNGVELPRRGQGYALLRDNGVRWGNPRLVAIIQAAAKQVRRERPGGAPLVIGDLAARRGGESSGHRSHRTGRDADLLIFVTTLDGRSVPSPGFLRFGPDGLAETEDKKFLRVDVEREWQLVKALLQSKEANVQWLFFAHWLEALVIEYAMSRGEDPELVWHAESVLLQPGDSAAHDDHLHLRIACTPDEAVAGCEGGGPYWPWIPELPQLVSPSDKELGGALLGDLGGLVAVTLDLFSQSAKALDHVLFDGDALDVCTKLPPEVAFDLVYLDPPYAAGGARTARAGKGEARAKLPRAAEGAAYADYDTAEELMAMLEPRLDAIRARMTAAATLWLHLDHRAVHDAKVACDRVFGAGAFLGEVIWIPGNGARGDKLSVTHQTILLFAQSGRGAKDVVWNSSDPDLREPFAATSLAMHFKRKDDAGRAYRERVIAGKTYRYYADEGRQRGSVWADIPAMLANTPLRAETTGYPTQKPERLLERIIRATSAPGATVADLMCGSGTTMVAAARLGRRAVGGDRSPVAIATTSARLDAAAIPYRKV